MRFSSSRIVAPHQDAPDASVVPAALDLVSPTTAESHASDQKEAAPAPSNLPIGNDMQDAEVEYLTLKPLMLLIVALVLVVLMMSLDMSILATAIPKITDAFHTIADIGWYAAAFMLTNASLQPLTGKVYTFFSLKTGFLSFITLFEVGSLICALANSSMMLIIGRAVCGIGASGLINGALTIVGIAAPPHQGPMMMGIVMAFAGAGQLVGPLIGGALTQHVSWRWCFWINLPIGGITGLILVLIRFPPYKTRKTDWKFTSIIRDFDIIGFIFFAPACIMLLLALQWGGVEYPWDSATIIGLFIGSGLSFVVFAFWEQHAGDDAMIPLSMMRQRVIYSSCITSALTFGSALLFSYYLPLWYQVVQSASPTMSAVYTLPTFVSHILAAVVAGAVLPMIGYLLPLVAIGTAGATISSGLMTTFTVTTGFAVWTGYQIIGGVGRGLCMQQPIQAVQAKVPPSLLPTATAAVSLAQSFGGAIFLGLGQTAFLNLLKSQLGEQAPSVDAQAVIDTGATAYLGTLTGSQDQVLRTQILTAYNGAITQTFYLAVAASLASFASGLAVGRTKVAQKKTNLKKGDDVEKDPVGIQREGRQNNTV